MERKRIIDCLSDQLWMKNFDDWYRISRKQINKLDRFNQSIQMLQNTYLTKKWDIKKLNGIGKSLENCPKGNCSSSIILQSMLLYIFYLFKLVIYEEYKHKQHFHSSGRLMVLDIYVSELQLALEYQGEQHYMVLYPTSDFEAQQQKDQEKWKACQKVIKKNWE